MSSTSVPKDASTVSLDDRPVLCMPAPDGDRLPRIYVDVHVGDNTKRLIAAVDLVFHLLLDSCEVG